MMIYARSCEAMTPGRCPGEQGGVDVWEVTDRFGQNDFLPIRPSS